jgi:hypothetical protein
LATFAGFAVFALRVVRAVCVVFAVGTRPLSSPAQACWLLTETVSPVMYDA